MAQSTHVVATLFKAKGLWPGMLGKYDPHPRWDTKGTQRIHPKARELARQCRSRRGQEEEMVCSEHRGNEAAKEVDGLREVAYPSRHS